MTDSLIGKLINRLTVISGCIIKSEKRNHNGYRCKCICGNETIVRATALRNGSIKSCGCYNVERTIETQSIHGQSKNGITYKSWESLRNRCNNPNNPEYYNYGGRGIRVCDRWNSFKNFLADMGERPSLEYSIDRYPNNNGNYEPANCRWATQKEQCRNLRVNKWIEYNGKTMIKTDWAEYLGMDLGTFRYHFKTKSMDKIVYFLKQKENKAVALDKDKDSHTANLEQQKQIA